MMEINTLKKEDAQEFIYCLAEAQGIVTRYSQLVAIDKVKDDDLRCHILYLLNGLQDIKERYQSFIED